MHQGYVYWLGYFPPHAIARAKVGAATAAELFVRATQQQGGSRCSRLLVSARDTLLVSCYSSTVIEEYSLTGAHGELLHAHHMPAVKVDGLTPSGIELFGYSEQADAYVAGLFLDGNLLFAGGWLQNNFTKLDVTFSLSNLTKLGGSPTAFMTVAAANGGGGGGGSGGGGGAGPLRPVGTSSSDRSIAVSLGVGFGIGLPALLATAFVLTRRGQPYGQSRTMLSSVRSFGVHRDAAGQPSAQRTTNPVTAQLEPVSAEMAGLD